MRHGPTVPAIPREAAERAGRTHGLGQAGSLTLDDVTSRFWCEVCRGEAGAARRHHQPHKLRRQGCEGSRHRPCSVGHDAPLNYVEAVSEERTGHHLT